RERVRDLLINAHLRRLPSCCYFDFQSGRSPTLILGDPIAHLPSVETDSADVILGRRIALILIALGDELGNHRMERFHSVLRWLPFQASLSDEAGLESLLGDKRPIARHAWFRHYRISVIEPHEYRLSVLARPIVINLDALHTVPLSERSQEGLHERVERPHQSTPTFCAQRSTTASTSGTPKGALSEATAMRTVPTSVPMVTTLLGVPTRASSSSR